MHNDACYFVLATMNFNCFKDFMEKRHYINKKKKACMLDMYGIIIFFFFFPFGLEMDVRRRRACHSYFCFSASRLFLSSEQKSATLEPSSHESLHLLPNRFEFLRTSASIVSALKAFLSQIPEWVTNLTWQTGKNSNVFFLLRMMPHSGD